EKADPIQEELDIFPVKFSTLGVDKDFSCQNTVKIVQSATRPGFFPLLAVWATLMAVAGEGNGTPLQYSCLENPMDGEAW
ncbi:hypothetical protein ACYCEV_09330, partial [Aerococcus mictus]